jgi:hypothetical protein
MDTETELAEKILPFLRAAVSNWSFFNRFSNAVAEILVPDAKTFEDEVGVLDAVSDICQRNPSAAYYTGDVTLKDALEVVRAGRKKEEA